MLGAALLLGGLGFAATRASDSGPSSPEAAVQALIDAVVDGDVIGVLEVLPAGERRALQEPLQDMTEELIRLGVLDDSFALGGVPGFEASVDGVELVTEDLADDVVAVRVVGGTFTGRLVPDEVPIGSPLRRAIEEASGEPLVIPDEEAVTEPLVQNGEGLRLVAIREGGGWRVSTGYSIAEMARQAEGLPAPDFAAGIEARGAASPEDAVQDMVQAGLALDLRRVIELLPPDEMVALHVYGPLFLDEVGGPDGGDFEVLEFDLELTTDQSGDIARVHLAALDLTVEVDDGWVSFGFDGDCFTVEQEFEGDYFTDTSCLSDLDDGELSFARGLGLGDFVAVTTVRVDGQWYVSPVRSVLDQVTAALQALPDDAVEQIPDLVEQFESTLESSFVFEEIEGGLTGPLGSPEDLPAPSTSVPTTSVPDAPEVPDPDRPTPDGPTFEGLVQVLLDDGFTVEEASCLADSLYQLALPDDALLGLELDDPTVFDDYPELADLIFDLYLECFD